MSKAIELITKEHVVGIFRGFTAGGLEFHADLALPYRSDFQNVPMHGQFLVVQLETSDEAVLGRITSVSSEGRLTGPSGEDFNIRALREERQVPEQLREDYLKYRVDIRVLGVLRREAGRHEPRFVPSHRRLPHVGSAVAFLNDALLRFVVGHEEKGADLGFLAFGEFVYAHGDKRFQPDNGLQARSPCAIVHFPVRSLVARRTLVFARAGFGKSNLNKLLFSKLYETTPTTTKRGGKEIPVGTLLFDPDGEYFWPDVKGRPGFCDVEHLREHLVVFTSREAPSPYYGSFVAGGIKLDIRRLRPGDVISIALPPEQQDKQNVRKLKGLNDVDWRTLVDLIHVDGNGADLNTIQGLMRLEPGQEVEALAARANMTTIVRMLHDPHSRLLDALMHALSEGKLCVVDVSQLRGEAALVLSGLILRRIFQRNQDEFTKADPRTIPTIAVVEEAQSVLRDGHSASAPYIEWVKEGRKYDLGAVLITQQPGSIPNEILSQGDNWFLFHLLSAADLQKVRQANAHFSEDILSALLNEPIPGQGVFWSSVEGKPYPVPLRVLSFEAEHKAQDAEYRRAAMTTYASSLRERFARMGQPAVPAPAVARAAEGEDVDGDALEAEAPDPLHVIRGQAIVSLQNNRELFRSLERGGIPYGVVGGMIEAALPEDLDDRKNTAFRWVPDVLSEVLGGRDKWDTERRQTKAGKMVSFVFLVKAQEQPE